MAVEQHALEGQAVDATRPRARRFAVLEAIRRAANRFRFLTVLVLMLALFAYFSLAEPRFFTSANMENLLTGVAVLWVISLGLTFVMLAGGLDLSLGSVLALAGVAVGALYVDAGLPAVAVVAIVLVGGGLLGGLVNGVLIGRLGLSFLVVTLGTLSLYRGALNLWSDGATTPVISSLFDSLAFGSLLGVPVPVWVMAGTLAVSLYVLRSTYFGRDVYAVGGNREAARLSGVDVARTLMLVYAVAGLLAALGGLLQVGRVGAASPLVGETIIFDAAAAVLLGGTSFAGGVGGVGGTAVGVLFLGVLQNGLSIAGVQSFWQQVVTGAILILAVGVDRLQREGWPAWRRTGHRATREASA